MIFFRFFVFLFFFLSFYFYYRISDLSDFPFPSVSACPSLASSPVVARRDSILKHSGSVKNTDRRVSINQPIVIEYLSEKRPSTQSQSTAANGNLSRSFARPASLILSNSKGERPTFKLIRTPSFDQDQDDTTLDQRNLNQTNTHLFATADLTSKDDDNIDESAPLVQNSNKDTIITSTTSHS